MQTQRLKSPAEFMGMHILHEVSVSHPGCSHGCSVGYYSTVAILTAQVACAFTKGLGCALQTPISIWQRIQKDGAGALKEILPKTKLWIPGNGGLQAYKQARAHTTPPSKNLVQMCCALCC